MASAAAGSTATWVQRSISTRWWLFVWIKYERMARPKAKIYTNSSWTTRGDQQRQEWEKLLINSFGAELIPSAVWKFSGFHIKYCKIGERAGCCCSCFGYFPLADPQWGLLRTKGSFGPGHSGCLENVFLLGIITGTLEYRAQIL